VSSWRCLASTTRDARLLDLQSREGDHEQDAEREVDRGEAAQRCGRTAVGEQYGDGRGEGKLFEHAGNDQRAIAARIGGDDQKRNLPGESDTDEAVEVLRVRDRGRIVVADASF
jgi:hypothetical protein